MSRRFPQHPRLRQCDGVRKRRQIAAARIRFTQVKQSGLREARFGYAYVGRKRIWVQLLVSGYVKLIIEDTIVHPFRLASRSI